MVEVKYFPRYLNISCQPINGLSRLQATVEHLQTSGTDTRKHLMCQTSDKPGPAIRKLVDLLGRPFDPEI